MANDISQLDEHVIREVLWHFSHPQGWRPGSFIESLLNTFGRADSANFESLSYAFPTYGLAMKTAMYQIDGLKTLSNYLIKRENNE